MKKVEMELVTSEVELARAALHLRAQDASHKSAATYRRISDRMGVVGLYEFNPFEAACISVSLLEFSEISDHIGLTALAHRAMALSNQFLCSCFLGAPERTQNFAQVVQIRKVGVSDATQSWASPAFR